MTQDASFRLRVQTEAARKLLDVLRDEGAADDEDLRADAIEGETDLHEAISSVIDAMDEDDILIAGGKAKIDDIAARVTAAEKRNETRKAAIEQAMMAAEISNVTLPSATVFVSKRKPKLVIQDEADIPSEFFVEQERPAPKLDKKALQSALTDGRAVPGAILDNGSVSLSIRRK